MSDVFRSGDASRLYSEKFGYRIYLRDLRTLSDRNWLNDNVWILLNLDIQIVNCTVQLAEEKATIGLELYFGDM